MNCDECKERVLDLIEQESGDPEAVRTLLERCPDCRARFDAMKATLEQLANFAVEEPSPATDQAVLAAARARVAARRSPRRRHWKAPPWAAAAVALLAVGVGVWAIPRGTEHAPTDRGEAPGGAQIEHDEAPVQAPAHEDSVAAPRSAMGARPRRESVAARSARESELVFPEADSDRAPRSSADFAAAEDATEQAAPKKSRALEAAPRSKSRRCERRLLGIERQDRAVTPEESLWLGACYREAGDWQRARRWFEQAASEPATRARAMRELGTLPSD
jgi:hypothetical protein